MSETPKQQPEPTSGAEAPAPPAQEQQQQPAQAAPPPPAEPPPPPMPAPPAPPAPRREPRNVRMWVAAVVAGVLLVGGGVGGYFIGAAADHGRPGVERSGDHGPRFGPPFRDRDQNRPFNG